MDTIRLRLNTAYDGSAYNGWQVQPDRKTVQGEVESALSNLYGGREIRVIAAGRTDTGVHAAGQVIHADVPPIRDETEIGNAMTALLPDDIRVWRARFVADDFHARFHAVERTYGYRILRGPDVFLRRYGWCPRQPFDPGEAERIAQNFLGKRSFRMFATQPDEKENFVCEVRSIGVREAPGGWTIVISADRFLRRMVRTVVGTLIEALAGKFDEKELDRMLAGEAERVGVPAPARGLALLRVRYECDDENDTPELSFWGGMA